MRWPMKTETVRGYSTHFGGEVELHAHLPTPAKFPVSRLQFITINHYGGWVRDHDLFGWAASVGSDLTRAHADRVIKFLGSSKGALWRKDYVLLAGEIFSDKHASFSMFVICPPEEKGQPHRVELKGFDFITDCIFGRSKTFVLPVVRRVCCEKV